jgi:hypothetical protein
VAFAAITAARRWGIAFAGDRIEIVEQQLADLGSSVVLMPLARGRRTADRPPGEAVYQAGDAEGELFLAMRYVEGGSLAQRLEASPPLLPKKPPSTGLAHQVDRRPSRRYGGRGSSRPLTW